MAVPSDRAIVADKVLRYEPSAGLEMVVTHYIDDGEILLELCGVRDTTFPKTSLAEKVEVAVRTIDPALTFGQLPAPELSVFTDDGTRYDFQLWGLTGGKRLLVLRATHKGQQWNIELPAVGQEVQHDAAIR